ncbi:hypothetical protein TNIN_69031 [Trichonephila inaurata madagascariensis]|uniref:Uncharacterized protein n=1 Tax=Trichonephila inaurata madagascariensis TaxID=2747483 RepID=A0A8X6IY40_9ARAC|nr:hypothetical protein TNIN_69031 [Trichonephila inaurata madagascariensis]
MKMDMEFGKPNKTKPCRMSPRQINILKDEIKRLLDLGGIEIGQTDLRRLSFWLRVHIEFPALLDYRRLNGITHIEFFPFPKKKKLWEKGLGPRHMDGLSRLE